MKLGEKYKYISTSKGLLPKSFRINWHITNWCNYKCEYCCQISKTNNDLSNKITQESAIKQAGYLSKIVGNKKILYSLSGGEISYLDLKKISLTLKGENKEDVTIVVTSNFSGKISTYVDFIAGSPNYSPCLNLSYQWTDLTTYMNKIDALRKGILKLNISNCNIEFSVVVWNKHTLEQVKEVKEAFDKRGCVMRFNLARLPNSGGKLAELDPEIEKYINAHNDSVGTKACFYAQDINGNDINLKSRMGVQMFKNEDGTDHIDPTGMICTTTPNIYCGEIRAATCTSKHNIKIGTLDDDGIWDNNGNPLQKLGPHTSICDTKGRGCNLCNILLIWNGKF